jgi:cell wall assembly regulator SMI1
LTALTNHEKNMHEIWKKFEAWLETNWPDGLKDLNPPATAEEISALETALGVSLPADYVACLKTHNGQANTVGGLFDNTDFLSTSAIFDQWKVWKELLDSGTFDGNNSEPEPGIKDDWWNAKWIPFTYNGCGDHHCLDLAPAQGGRVGQVITMWHDMGERTLLADSFSSWFDAYVRDVIAGKYVYSDHFGGLTNVTHLE